MEELVGGNAHVLVASRPNFGFNELDFVFSTLVVGCILNFVLIYLLVPTMYAPRPSHRFSPIAQPAICLSLDPAVLSTDWELFVYRGTLFAAVGFAAGLVGTVLSNGLIMTDPQFATPNKAQPTILNVRTWAIHMGLSNNLRYQTLNGEEFSLTNVLPLVAFKSSVLVLRCLNNVLGGMSFVVLARLTGSQSIGEEKKAVVTTDEEGSVEKKWLNESEDSSSIQPKKSSNNKKDQSCPPISLNLNHP